MASDRQYFIVTQSSRFSVSCKKGKICSAPSFKLKKKNKTLDVDVVFTDSVAGVDYPVDKDFLQPISPEEAGLLMALPEEDRLQALNQPQGLRSARRLKEGTEVWVQHREQTLRGVIRFIGSITEYRHKWNVPGVFYGVELQGSDRGQGDTDGSHKHKRCFTCDKNCGVFASFDRITADGPQTSPGPQPGPSSRSSPGPQLRGSPELKLKLSMKSRPESRPESRPGSDPDRDRDQLLSFRSDHFQDSAQRETRPGPRSEPGCDSGPKSLCVDPKPMEEEPVYEDPDQDRRPARVLDRFRSQSAKQAPVSDKTDRKDKPKARLDLVPGQAKRAAPPSPESEDHEKSKPKTRLATSRFRPEPRPGLRTTPQTRARSGPESGPESTAALQTGDRVLFIDESEQTVRGTFYYMTETDGRTTAHIKEDSGTSLEVPLEGLMKLEQDTETENIYDDPNTAPGVELEESRPESIDHAKSSSDTAKNSPTRSQSETEPMARPRIRARTGLESPGGPKSGSAEGLSAGDHVRFIGDKEQVFQGTVVFMEDTDKGTVVYITGDAKMFSVPLSCVMKVEPKTGSEDLYMDPDSTAPPVERQEGCMSLGLDSVVEIDLAKGAKGFGTIRWIGFLPEVKQKMAGLELEEPRGVSDGTFRGQRFFSCPDRHALFVKLSSCRPDSRFCKHSANQSSPRAGPAHNGFTQDQNDTEERDLEPVPPVAADNVERLLVGRMKGIQGHHNSCYMDSALFSLFSVSSVLDSLLFKSTSPQDAEVQRILLRDIVNPLRRRGFVEGRHVMNLRKQLQNHGFSHSFTTDEKDPEEFLTVIMQHILNLDPLLKLCSGGKVQDSFCFQIFLDQNQDLVLPSVQQLLEHSFHSNGLKLSEVPSCLILQMPRFGKKFKMFDKILPSLELDITDLLQHGPKQCVLCGGAALWECSDCFQDPTFGSRLKLFCDQCKRQVHIHPRRRGHGPAPLDTRHHGHGECFRGNREKLHLLAVLCIETSHYVSFVKYGPEPQHWLFFDSMADREGEADGFNVPQVSLAPELGHYLNMSLSELANQAPRDMRGVAKRLLCDAYLYLYQSPTLHLYT